MALTKASINQIGVQIETPMKDAESDLKKLLDNVNNGGDVTTVELLRIQMAMSRYTLTGSIFSAIIKELSDSLKGITSKIS
ncbi:MAG: EscF/YscF/HrpA family type III secretion system needle major subunit [Oxalobacteraceae bacterium]|nr:EscF/YscF/HrpA family type III secretion system needle major subunit [Oxalobacteraceae bacterium]